MREHFSFNGLTIILILAVLLLVAAGVSWFLNYLNRQAPPSYTRLVAAYLACKEVIGVNDGCQGCRISWRIIHQL